LQTILTGLEKFLKNNMIVSGHKCPTNILS